jgi:hypothetical protein
MRSSRKAPVGFFVTTAVVLLLAIGAASKAADTTSSGVLDGMTFVGDLGEKGKTKGDKDTYEFKGGTFHSTACDGYGFKAAAYTATANGEVIKFESTTHSDKEGEMVWKGTVKGGHMEGTIVWTKGSQAIDYWFKGSAAAMMKE